MATRSTSLEKKIEQQKQVVFKAKDKYDAAVAKLEELIKMRDEHRNKELVKAFTDSDKSFDEVMNFLRSKTSKE